jgi:hypothetical protein
MSPEEGERDPLIFGENNKLIRGIEEEKRKRNENTRR